jgi:hypothetical protein
LPLGTAAATAFAFGAGAGIIMSYLAEGLEGRRTL